MQSEEQQPEKAAESDKDEEALAQNKPSSEIERSITLRRAEFFEEFSGPLPHPQALKAYDIVLPGAAERIISMAEKQQAHRLYLERTVIDGDTKRASLGLAAGALFPLVHLGLAST
jgi:uncharacterized membrane protein